MFIVSVEQVEMWIASSRAGIFAEEGNVICALNILRILSFWEKEEIINLQNDLIATNWTYCGDFVNCSTNRNKNYVIILPLAEKHYTVYHKHKLKKKKKNRERMDNWKVVN